MEYGMAVKEQTEQIFQLVQDTIAEVYPKYYPKEIVDFFRRLHDRKSIAEDIEKGGMRVLVHKGRIVGTGSYEEDHITRVYVSPRAQGQGCGSVLMRGLENEIALSHDSIRLDASLPAGRFYEDRGYRTIKHDRLAVDNGVILAYEIMEKPLYRFQLTLDRKDYDPAGVPFRRTAVRGIIKKEDTYALIYSAKYGECKFPGGGREEGESLEDTLVREVQEETGLAVKRASIRYAGVVEEIRKGIYDDVFHMTSLYYFCDAEEELKERNLNDYEAEEGYELTYLTLREAIENNDGITDRQNLPWIDRDTAVMKLLLEREGMQEPYN